MGAVHVCTRTQGLPEALQFTIDSQLKNLHGRNVFVLHKAEVALLHGVGCKLVDQSLSRNPLQDLAFVVISEGSAHLLVIHTSPVFPLTP